MEQEKIIKREIKFRLWNRKNKKMAHGITIPLIARERENVLAYPTDTYDWMQYTGLKDNSYSPQFPDGHEIYEGDIVKVGNDVAEVYYGGAMFFVRFQNSAKDTLSLTHCRNEPLKVIGNIYETLNLKKNANSG